ncbi:MAG: phytanoyl-CoA dioxygenase family protein [Pyrinomonadaceae bacterium]
MNVNTLTDQVPDISGVYRISDAQVEAFRGDGHVKLGGVFTTEEVEVYREHFRRVVESNSDGSHGMEQRVAGAAKNWKFVNNLWALDEAVRRFVLSRRLGRMAADLMEVDAVRLFRDQSYFKGPQGANTPWHQDAYFMPLDTEKVLTMWIPLTDITPDLAPMSYVTGSNRAGYMGTSNGDNASMDSFEEKVRSEGFEVFNYGTFQTGDVAVHSAWTLHSSRTNTSPLMREAIVIVYFADGARLIEDPPLTPTTPPQEFYARLIRQQNRQTSLPGLKSGDLAAGTMTPLVYSRSWDEA